MSSAAMVSPRIRLSAKARSSGMFLSRWLPAQKGRANARRPRYGAGEARGSAEGSSRGVGYWQTMSMSRCSSTVLIVKGRVGFVEEGSTFGSEHTFGGEEGPGL